MEQVRTQKTGTYWNENHDKVAVIPPNELGRVYQKYELQEDSRINGRRLKQGTKLLIVGFVSFDAPLIVPENDVVYENP